ncbi:glycosyltransferase [Streptomyces sp. NPDC090085]|uniref:glycosyltransferase n=1 Tax=Streptomyces sp. NPDC090085 TaxID=3365943 RepID=UPI00380388CE
MKSLRIMVVPSPAAGHFFPMVPLLWALRIAGHDVRVVVPSFFVSAVLQSGLPAIATAPHDEAVAVDPRDDLDDDHTTGTYRRIARISAAMELDVDAIVDEWRPQLVISDPMDFTGRRAAADHGLPYVEHWIGQFLPTESRVRAARHVFGARSVRWPGTGADPGIAVDPCPPGFQSAGAPTAVRTRYVPYNGPALLPRWLADRDRPRRVLVTLGTIVSQGPAAHRLLEEVLDATDGLDTEVVIAARRDSVPEELARRARTVRWLPIGLTAQRCDLVVHHGGSGTTMSVLAHGVPQVVCPSVLDQADNALRVDQVGAGLMVPLPEALAGKGAVARAVERVLGDAAYLEVAAALRDENDTAPTPAAAAEQLLHTAVGS